MPQYEIPADLLRAIADYLSTRPYREVVGLMAALATIRESDQDKKDDASSSSL